MAMTPTAMHTDFDFGAVIERADGYYWRFKGVDIEHGPFASPIDAISAMEDDDLSPDSADVEAGEAEFGVGGAAWLDADSGGLPEASILHLEEYN